MPDTPSELNGRAAVVTGSAKNIGRAIALDLDVGGADALINARTSWAEAEQTARDVEPLSSRASSIWATSRSRTLRAR